MEQRFIGSAMDLRRYLREAFGDPIDHLPEIAMLFTAIAAGIRIGELNDEAALVRCDRAFAKAHSGARARQRVDLDEAA